MEKWIFRTYNFINFTLTFVRELRFGIYLRQTEGKTKGGGSTMMMDLGQHKFSRKRDGIDIVFRLNIDILQHNPNGVA